MLLRTLQSKMAEPNDHWWKVTSGFHTTGNEAPSLPSTHTHRHTDTDTDTHTHTHTHTHHRGRGQAQLPAEAPWALLPKSQALGALGADLQNVTALPQGLQGGGARSRHNS